MNGRLYDPLLHRFLQPDNFVQDPYYSQSYNRYGYVFNNPLRYIDPTGQVTQDDIDKAIKDGLNSNNGGSWSESTGFQPFGSRFDSFAAADNYNTMFGSWGSTLAGSYDNAWYNYSHNVAADDPKGKNKGSTVAWVENGIVHIEYRGARNANQGDDRASAKNNNNSSSWWEHLIGPGLATLGADIVPKTFAARYIRSFIIPNAGKYTSVASIAFRKIIPSTWKTRGLLPKSISLGGQLGRTVPYLGWAITVYDLTYNGSSWAAGEIINALPYNEEVKKPELMSDGSIWHPEH